MATRPTIREARNGHAATVGQVVLLDGHPIWLDALETLLESHGVGVAGKTTSPEAALQIVAAANPEGLVVSIDLAGSGTDGAEVLRRARERWPHLRTIAFSTYDDPFHASAAASAGADAYLVKTADASEVVRTIRTCLQNGSCPRASSTVNGKASERPVLTARELEIVHLVARGYTNVQIAQHLWVTSSTVKFHLVNAYRKLGVSNRTQAARYLYEHGLSDSPIDRSA